MGLSGSGLQECAELELDATKGSLQFEVSMTDYILKSRKDTYNL